jgi:hypothetical protein
VTGASPTTDVSLLARRYRVEFNTGTEASPVWSVLYGVTGVKRVWDTRTTDAETTEDAGFGRDEVTGAKWGWEITFDARRDSAGTAINALHADLRAASVATTTNGVQRQIRVYDRDGIEAGQTGWVRVEWSDKGGGGKDLDTATIKCMGQGVPTSITNPLAVTTPVVTGLTPTGVATAGGKPVVVTGINFTGATGVTVGGTAVTTFTVIDSRTVLIVSPAKSAGTYDVVVTTAGGASPTTGTGNDLTYS